MLDFHIFSEFPYELKCLILSFSMSARVICISKEMDKIYADLEMKTIPTRYSIIAKAQGLNTLMELQDKIREIANYYKIHRVEIINKSFDYIKKILEITIANLIKANNLFQTYNTGNIFKKVTTIENMIICINEMIIDHQIEYYENREKLIPRLDENSMPAIRDYRSRFKFRHRFLTMLLLNNERLEKLFNLGYNKCELNFDDNQIFYIAEFPKSDARLTGLSLKNNQIKYLPESIENLKRLGNLNLVDNFISELPSTMLNLKLDELLISLEKNCFEKIPEILPKTSLVRFTDSGGGSESVTDDIVQQSQVKEKIKPLI